MKLRLIGAISKYKRNSRQNLQNDLVIKPLQPSFISTAAYLNELRKNK
jgi:hypothetical protein